MNPSYHPQVIKNTKWESVCMKIHPLMSLPLPYTKSPQGSTISILARLVMVMLVLNIAPLAINAQVLVFGKKSYNFNYGLFGYFTENFEIEKTAEMYIITIQNGDESGKRRVKNGKVILNDLMIPLSQQNDVIQQKVRLKSKNLINVRLVGGEEGAFITIGISYIGQIPPTIAGVITPTPNADGWNKSNATVSFTCSSLSSVISFCSVPVPVTAETSGQFVLGTASDKAGMTSTTSLTVKLDKTSPSLTVTSPSNGANIYVSSVMINGTVTDELSGIADVKCNGITATIIGSSFSCAVSLMPGSNSINISAADVAGNVSTSLRPLIYTRAPTIKITSPAGLSYLNISPTTVTGTVDDGAATVTINSIQAAVVNGAFSVALPLAEGPNLITASATSANGATGTASIEVTLDTTPPRATITSPANQFVTTDAAISVAGSINDIVVGTVNPQQAQVSVNGVTAQVANRTFLAVNVPLSIGANVIQAVGRDRVGNAATTQITVVRQAAMQAQIRLISGNNQTGAIGSILSAPLVVRVTDAVGNPVSNKQVIFKVTQNDGMVTAVSTPAPTVIATTNAQGQAQVQWKLGMRGGAGGNVVEAYAVGFNGTAIFTATGTQGSAGMIVVDSGNDQIGNINQPLPKPLIAVVVDAGNNRLAGVPVTFTVKEGGGNFGGQSTFTVNSDSDGRVAAILTLGLQEGNANNLVQANFSSNTNYPASFTASGRVPSNPLNTTISGVVLDNSNVPIPGVTIRAVLTNLLNSNSNIIQSVAAVQTNTEGQFIIQQAPVGFVKLLVDGSTVTRPGTYPSLDYDVITIAGQANKLTGPIFLLPLNTNNQLCVTATTGGGTLTIPEAPGFSLTFGPGQVTFPGGSKTGCVSVTVVNSDKVPMTPGFGQQPKFIVTIQPSGAIFNPPAAITLPNVDGLRPRAVTEMYSFDHDIGLFVAIGSGTVSDDGLVIRSNPGVGVLKAGWHCGGDPQANGTAANCGDCKICLDDRCQFDIIKQCTCCGNGTGVCDFGNCDPVSASQCPVSQTITPTTTLDQNYFYLQKLCSNKSEVLWGTTAIMRHPEPFPTVKACIGGNCSWGYRVENFKMTIGWTVCNNELTRNRIDVDSLFSPYISADTYCNIIKDLTPDADGVPNRSVYWSSPIVKQHELYHTEELKKALLQNWEKFQKDVEALSAPFSCSEKTTATAINTVKNAIEHRVTELLDTTEATVRGWGHKQANLDGKASYEALTRGICLRAKNAGWTKSDPCNVCY